MGITLRCGPPSMPQGTELQDLLQRHGCDTVIVGGVMTNLCCETTARWVVAPCWRCCRSTAVFALGCRLPALHSCSADLC